MIRQMDQWLATYANITREKYPNADPDHPGTGAAGGLGFAFLSYTNAILQSGIQIILEETRLESCIKDADIVITGEGRLDGQTIMGKPPSVSPPSQKNTTKQSLLSPAAPPLKPASATSTALTPSSPSSTP